MYPIAIGCTSNKIELKKYDYTKEVLYVSLIEHSFNKKEGALGQKDFDVLQRILLSKDSKIVKTSRSSPTDEPTLYKDVPLWTF